MMRGNVEVCIFMDKEEMEGLRNSYSTMKYHGSSPDEDVWAEILQSSLYRRFATEPMAEAIFTDCGAPAERIIKALMYGKGAFDKREFESDLIMSSWGKPIAKKVINYKASEEKRLLIATQVNTEKLPSVGLKVVVDNTLSIGQTTDQLVGEVVATEWGAF
jgi:hypothetical protein